jgi:hypothetical protein
MQVTALYDMHFGHGNSAEVIHRGTTFSPPGTGQMNAREHAQSLIHQGACCAEEDFARLNAKREAGAKWAVGEVARLTTIRRG